MGGSVSYLSGVNGFRINPANVQFNSEKKWTVKLGLLSMVNPNISTTANEKSDLSSWLVTYEPYQPVSASPVNSLPQTKAKSIGYLRTLRNPLIFALQQLKNCYRLDFTMTNFFIGLYAEYVFAILSSESRVV